MGIVWRRAVRVVLLALPLRLAALAAAASEEDLLQLEAQAVRQAVARVAPSVLRLETVGGMERVEGQLVGDGPTTGLVVSADGLIVSSVFNFARQPTSILAVLPGGTRAPAEVVARDHSRMLVLLRAKPDQPLLVPEPAPLEEMAVGQRVIALGRTLDAERPNISVGILSAKNRIWGRAVQTDARVSPSNYGGPLIDLRGRVLGILVPLSPDSQEEIAGSEWYDSGIGFAIPLVDLFKQLPRLRKGENLYPGLLGITLRGQDIYSSPAEVAAVQARSPAYAAGLRAGDTIVAVDGAAVERQAQLKHALGTRYAGDEVRLVALRGSQRLEMTATLTDQLVPYEHPFLGILPRRDAAPGDAGVRVRFVYPRSGAAESGIQPGDRIVSLGGQPVADAAALRLAVAQLETTGGAALGVERQGEVRRIEVRLGSLPPEIPESLPAAREPRPAAGAAPADRGMIDVRIPEEPHTCLAYVPPSYDPAVPHGLVVHLAAPGPFDRQAFLAEWRDACAAHDLIVVAVQPQQARSWLPMEAESVRKVMDRMLGRYAIDRTRVVAHGCQAGGAMALLVALRHRAVVRGAAAVDASLPRIRPPDNDPAERLAFYLAWATESPAAERARADAARLREMKYPVTVKEMSGKPRPWNEREAGEFFRWIDTLDRI